MLADRVKVFVDKRETAAVFGDGQSCRSCGPASTAIAGSSDSDDRPALGNASLRLYGPLAASGVADLSHVHCEDADSPCQV